MPLPSRFGPYEITGPLGAGGMGQVFRARDTRLQRTVAVKILHEAGGLDPARQQRFAREAVAASALNHPNIITVYDVGVEGETPYLVSELIDGDSLRSEMLRGRLPLKRAIEITRQIAEGLAAAHEAGIVHRDLKPENVMVTPDDRVKIVDFGLAMADGSDEVLLAGQTRTETADGLIVGTVPYMSPEQARGGRADFRSDQFALGVMLYEMATATHPFQRETSVQTLSAIIADDPPDPALATPPVPLAVRLLLRRLLAKNPRERFAHTADLAADLRTIREVLAESASGVTTPVADPPATWPLRVASAALVGAVGLFGGWALATADNRASFERFTPFATDAGYQGVPAWSPDGRTIAYEAEIDGVVQIFTRSLGSPMRTQVTRSAFDCFSPFWSTDGRTIYYHSLARDTDALWRVSPAGGAPDVVIEGAARAHISPDGRAAVFLRQEPLETNMTLWTVALPDGTPERYARGALADEDFAGGYLRFSPSGTKVMAWLGPTRSTSVAGFWELPMPRGEPRSLPYLGGGDLRPPSFTWLPDNRHLVVTRSDGPTPGTHLWLADTRTERVTPLTTTALNESSPGLSPDGRTLAFDSQATDFDLVEVPLDGSPLRPFLSSTRNEYDPATSPVSTQFAYVTDRTGSLQIWLQNEEGYLQQPLVSETDFKGGASLAIGALAFSPDGKRLAFQRAQEATAQDSQRGFRLWITSTSGGPPMAIGGAASYQDAPTWSPDGEWIAFISRPMSGGSLGLMKARVGDAGKPVVLAAEIPPFLARPQWSPNGQSILCETADGLTIVAADGSGSRVLTDPGWLAYAWDADGRRVYGLRPTDDQHHFMFVVLDAQTGAEKVINANLGTIPQALQPIRGFSRLRNGSFLTSIARVRSDIYLMEGLRLPGTLWQRLWPFANLGR
ncbi:MAG: serine/threonine-protein kinase [Acidobacteria bacterium]|nr:serine/threonine-protein kinase [Acidobacteriota bacterium]